MPPPAPLLNCPGFLGLPPRVWSVSEKSSAMAQSCAVPLLPKSFRITLKASSLAAPLPNNLRMVSIWDSSRPLPNSLRISSTCSLSPPSLASGAGAPSGAGGSWPPGMSPPASSCFRSGRSSMSRPAYGVSGSWATRVRSSFWETAPTSISVFPVVASVARSCAFSDSVSS